jgi:uncharacterized protein YceK
LGVNVEGGMTFRLASLVCILALELCGCSTFLSKDAEGFGRAYSGVACDSGYVANLFKLGWGAHLVLLPYIVIDLPLSFVADTIVLPVDLAKPRPQQTQCIEIGMH